MFFSEKSITAFSMVVTYIWVRSERLSFLFLPFIVTSSAAYSVRSKALFPSAFGSSPYGLTRRRLIRSGGEKRFAENGDEDLPVNFYSEMCNNVLRKDKGEILNCVLHHATHVQISQAVFPSPRLPVDFLDWKLKVWYQTISLHLTKYMGGGTDFNGAAE